MKKVALLFFFGLFMSTCQKDSDNAPPPPDVVKGVMVDILDQKGIEGVVVYVNHIEYDGFNIKAITKIDSAVTDAEGKFEMKNVTRCGNVGCILKIESIPSGYQRGVRINGYDEDCVVSHYGYTDAIFGYHFTLGIEQCR
jgi:hypothetical protein